MIRGDKSVSTILKAAVKTALAVCAFVSVARIGEVGAFAAGSLEKSVGTVKAGGLIRQCGIGALQEEFDINAEYEGIYDGSAWKKNFTKKDLKYMASIIYCEAMDMCLEARVAVGNVILNRMYDTKDWGHVNTVKEVIYDRKWGIQFSPTAGSNSKMDAALKLYSNKDSGDYADWQVRCMNGAIEAAKLVLAGYKTVPDDFIYFNGHIENSKKKCEDAGRRYIIMDGHIYFE